MIASIVRECSESARERTAQAERIETQTNTAIVEHTRRIEQLLEAIELLRHRRFGPRRADRIPEGQLSLFDEAELEALIGEFEAALPAPSETPASKSADTEMPKRKPVRRPLLGNHHLADPDQEAAKNSRG